MMKQKKLSEKDSDYSLLANHHKLPQYKDEKVFKIPFEDEICYTKLNFRNAIPVNHYDVIVSSYVYDTDPEVPKCLKVDDLGTFNVSGLGILNDTIHNRMTPKGDYDMFDPAYGDGLDFTESFRRNGVIKAVTDNLFGKDSISKLQHKQSKENLKDMSNKLNTTKKLMSDNKISKSEALQKIVNTLRYDFYSEYKPLTKKSIHDVMSLGKDKNIHVIGDSAFIKAKNNLYSNTFARNTKLPDCFLHNVFIIIDDKYKEVKPFTIDDVVTIINNVEEFVHSKLHNISFDGAVKCLIYKA